MSREIRNNLSPALVGSVALHGAVAVAILIGLPPRASKPVTIGETVPVTIVTEGPTNVRPAVQDAVDQTAQAEEVTPEATPEPPAPIPAPTPQPSPAAPPKPAPTPTPTPKKPLPSPKADNDFFASLEKTLAKTPQAKGKPVANAAKGPARAETATEARPAAGAATALQAAAIAGMKDEIQRRWNPTCEVEGGGAVQVRVSFKLTTAGRISGQVTAAEAERANDPVVRAAAERAIRAVYQSAPFEGLPPDYYGPSLNLNFKARDACAAR